MKVLLSLSVLLWSQYVKSREEGTYLCVVSACGHTLTGTRIHVNGEELLGLSPAVIVLTVLNIVLCSAVVVLVRMVCSLRKNQLKEVDSGLGPTHREQAEDEVTYAGVKVVPRSASVSQRLDPVVYSEVKKRQDRPPRCY
uniref:Uncharacterized protein n=1 Tax=Knipowitschia caucasica TaxID=637954 RepID=A0AAV2J9J0_KNICA